MLPSSVDRPSQVETGATSLRQELETVRQALKMQTARRRQVDAALYRRLEKKDMEIQRWKTLRDQQLSHVMRALFVLEAGLRREQRDMRALLGERDAVIHAQRQEIARLRKTLGQQEETSSVTDGPATQADTLPKDFHFDCDVKPDLISSLGISHFNRRDTKSVTPTTTDNEDSQSNLDSLQLSFYEVGSQPESLMSNLSTQSCNGDTSESNDPGLEPVLQKTPQDNWSETTTVQPFDNYVVQQKSSKSQDIVNSLKRIEVKVDLDPQYTQKNILSPVKEESSTSIMSASSSPARYYPCADTKAKTTLTPPATYYEDARPSPSALLQEVRISGKNEYEDNPVLNCVNQILLRDQEEFLEEQRAIRLKEQEKCKKDAEALNNKKLTKSTENLSLLNEQIVVQHCPVKAKIYSPIDTQLTMEQLVQRNNVNDGQDDNYNSISSLSSPRKRLLDDKPQVKSLPPAIPPKPQRLSKTLDQKTVINTIIPQFNGRQGDAIEIIKKRASLPPSTDSELYVISNSAIDDELLHQLQGRRAKSCSTLQVGLVKSNTLTQSRENIYASIVSHPTHKPQVKLKVTTHVQHDKAQKKPSTSQEDESRTPPSNSPAKNVMSPNSCIKVASPVSSLINRVDSIESSKEVDDANVKKTSPSVSQIVRRFEDLGSKSVKEQDSQIQSTEDSLQKNFEEFRLDECDMDALCRDDRPEGDGAERLLEARISYENFLEATGLSQKSIVTPSRMFSNHKSVMKPKDVKHRSRVKAAAVNTGVRYWTEPFL